MNTFKFMSSFPIDYDNFASTMSNIRSKLYSTGVCWTDSVQGKFTRETPFRVVLHTRRENVDFKNPMVKECNGLVFEFCDGWHLLAMPHHAFCTNKISMRRLVDLFSAGHYDVYEVLDATILTLYFYNGEWVVSSTKGYDIGAMEMVSGFTFMDAIKDLMATKYKAFSFEMLNPDYSYTIALRHSKYHIFDETKHLANRTKNVPKPGVDMNSYIMIMSVSEPMTFSFVSRQVPGLPTHNALSLKESNVSLLMNYAKSAYAKYAKAYQLQNFKYKPLYGYILRAKHRSVPDEYSTIYIESELYKAIKIGLYKNNGAIRACDYSKLVVQMSANCDRFGQFQIMFQQFSSKFEQLKQILDEVAGAVTHRIVEEHADANVEAKNPSEQTPAEALIDGLVAKFKDEPDITPGIIKDAMYSREYAHALSELLG